MKTIFDPETKNEMLSRIEKLSPVSARLWGKMDVAQMMAHCSNALAVATGEIKHSRTFIGRIIGPLAKKDFLSDKPFGKNNPTDPNFIVNERKNFEGEKTRLISGVNKISSMGRENITDHEHPFGMLKTDEWGMSVCKHLDHHLRQFGV